MRKFQAKNLACEEYITIFLLTVLHFYLKISYMQKIHFDSMYPHCLPLTLARTHLPIFLPTSILFSLFFYYNIGYFSVPLVMPIYAGCRVIHWATTNHIPKLKWVSFLQLQGRPWEPLPFPPRELNQLRVLLSLPLCFNVLKSRNSRFVGNSLQNTLFL